MPDLKILNVNGTNYTVVDAAAQSAASAAQSTASAAQTAADNAQSTADANKVTVSYSEDSATLTITTGGESA